MSTLAELRADPALVALRRSLDIYYGDPERDAAMDRLYARFLKPGDLAFDIGSHVGDRIASFRRLGARVVALEPQPDCARVIRALYGNDPHIILVEAACGPEPGRMTLHVNSANPTVTTASHEFVRAAEKQAGWEGQVWDRAIEVPVTTLDALITEHGMPAFVKIDVEGFEYAVLEGLTQALPALSFELTTIQRDVAERCLERLAGLGCKPMGPGRPIGETGVDATEGKGYLFNIALGETQRLTLEGWVTGAEMAAHIRALPHEANSGDVYAIATVPG